MGNSRGHERPSVPLRQLPAHHEGHPACFPAHRGGTQMTTIAKLALSRRNLLKGGALIVGFNIAGPLTNPLLDSLVTSAAAGTPDPELLDSWIAVHADNTATVFMGKGRARPRHHDRDAADRR